MKKNKYKNNKRYYKIAFQIQKDLSKIILKNFFYFNINHITITKVELKSKYNNAKIFFSILKKKNINIIKKILNNNSKYLKKKLSKFLTTYNTPNLEFIYDDSLNYTNKILNLIKIANKKKI